MKNITRLEILYKRCVIHAKRKGYNQIAEDFASWQTIKYLNGKSQKQTISQSFIDYLREQNDFSRRSCSFNELFGISSRGNDSNLPEYSKHYNNSFIKQFELHDKNFENNFSEITGYGDSFDTSRINFKNIRQQLVFELYLNGYTLFEIGEILGFTESRCSQIFKQIKTEVLNQIGFKLMKEKIELDETNLKINWIEF